MRCRVDLDQSVERAADGTIARRAITDEGRLIWLVQAPGRRRGYHAAAASVEDAFDEADDARVRRRTIGRRWAEIARLRRHVLLGRQRYFTTVSDARHAGLCELGIDGFLARIGLSGRGGAPAFVLALASFVDRQPGYAMFAAYLRIERQKAAGAGGVSASDRWLAVPRGARFADERTGGLFNLVRTRLIYDEPGGGSLLFQMSRAISQVPSACRW